MSAPSAAEAAADFLTEIFDHLDYAIDIKAEQRGEMCVLELDGDDIERLESRPELVSALTLLTSQAASRATEERVRVLLDIGGAFDDKKAVLEAAAHDIARAVDRSGRRAVLGGLNSAERRVVHNALADDERVQTRSEGDESDRRLLVERA